MPKPFEALRERLLCAGVAPRYAHRYLRELRDHFIDLVAEEVASAPTQGDAEARAMERLGTTEALATAMIDRSQFRAWSHRAPLAVYVLAPPVTLGLCFAGAMLLIVAISTIYRTSLGAHSAPPSWFGAMTKGLSFLTAFVIPVLLGWNVVMLAFRQRARRLWPAFGVAVIAILGAAAQLDITLPTSAAHGEIDIASVFLPPFAGVDVAALHAAANLVTICAPYLTFYWPWQRDAHLRAGDQR